MIITTVAFLDMCCPFMLLHNYFVKLVKSRERATIFDLINMARVGVEKITFLPGRSQKYFPNQYSFWRIVVIYIFYRVTFNNNVIAQHERVAPGVPPQKYQETPSMPKPGICVWLLSP